MDHADDIVLLLHTQQQMQDKTSKLKTILSKIGVTINKKTKLMKINTKSTSRTRLEKGEIEEVMSFTNLGTLVVITGGTQVDTKTRIGKARTVFSFQNKVWSKQIAANTKVQIFNSCEVCGVVWG